MRLSRFRVQNYKVIDDTGEVEVDAAVTALVGRNESGKTAILRSLWKSRNVAGEEFDKLLDYPRARFATERKGSQYVTTLDFALTPEESIELAAQFPFDLEAPPETVSLKTWYVGEDKTSRSVAFEDRIEKRCKRDGSEIKKIVESVASKMARHVGDGDATIADAKKATFAQVDAQHPVWQKVNKQAVEAFKTVVDTWIGGAAERAPHAQAERKKLDDLVGEAQKGDPATKAREWTEKHLPFFIYFDNYGQLETRIHLPTYLSQSKESHISPRLRTQRALFRWSGIDPEEIQRLGLPEQPGETTEAVQRRLDKRRTLLESASFHLTGEWTDWWIPDTQHQLHISADREYLVLNVSDTKNPFQIPFEERSHGFQWFFSFYLVFLVESEDAHEGAVLLLDEPGLHLHPTMQSKLVGLFERISKSNQILYSTHLPFLVDGDHLERVRTVYLSKEKPPKTIVSSDPCAGGDRDTLFPLQAALGYSIAQTMFLGKRPVIVEGLTDYMLMKALNICLGALKTGTRLHDEVVLVPAGGTKRLMPLASIMFAESGVEGRRMLVLLDSDDAGTSAGARLQSDLFGSDSGVLMLGKAIGFAEATIEDLMLRADYSKAVGAAFERAINLDADEMAAPTNVTALSKHWQRQGLGTFGKDEKVATALRLIDVWERDPKLVPTETIKRVSALFEAINRRFE